MFLEKGLFYQYHRQRDAGFLVNGGQFNGWRRLNIQNGEEKEHIVERKKITYSALKLLFYLLLVTALICFPAKFLTSTDIFCSVYLCSVNHCG